jgi:hypothetical protein
MVRILLEKGANLTIKDKTERNALEIAQFLKQKEIIEILEISYQKQHFQYFKIIIGNKYCDCHFNF